MIYELVSFVEDLWLCQLLAVDPSGSYLTTLNLNVHICKKNKKQNKQKNIWLTQGV